MRQKSEIKRVKDLPESTKQERRAETEGEK
jgi:hypothetical protein